jgi:hypothetical protein
MAKSSARWTPDEILSELRRREVAEAQPPGARGIEPPARERRVRDIAAVPSNDLTAELKAGQRAIYGVDDRRETFDLPAASRRLADASVALVETSDLERAGTEWRLKTVSFRDEYNLCSDEHFVNQPLGCFCSGVLVAPDVIATAGHCIEKPADLETTRFVFGFRMLDATRAQVKFPEADVYSGVEILGRRLTADGTDWALIRLDRRVTGRTPVKFRTAGKIPAAEPLMVIGHPCGLPQKFAAGAAVQQNSRRDYFVANLDTYGGNSGSPVFSTKTRTLEGLLVRGQTDFVKVGNCRISQVFPSTGAGGEDVTRSTVWAANVKAPKTAAAKAKQVKRRQPVRRRGAKRGRASRG